MSAKLILIIHFPPGLTIFPSSPENIDPLIASKCQFMSMNSVFPKFTHFAPVDPAQCFAKGTIPWAFPIIVGTDSPLCLNMLNLLDNLSYY